jgi:hypothetical protein
MKENQLIMGFRYYERMMASRYLPLSPSDRQYSHHHAKYIHAVSQTATPYQCRFIAITPHSLTPSLCSLWHMVLKPRKKNMWTNDNAHHCHPVISPPAPPISASPQYIHTIYPRSMVAFYILNSSSIRFRQPTHVRLKQDNQSKNSGGFQSLGVRYPKWGLVPTRRSVETKEGVPDVNLRTRSDHIISYRQGLRTG